LNADGTNPTKLSDGKYDAAPACSPDGQWAYYVDGLQSLKRVPIQGGAVESIPLQVPNVERILGTVSFSPDGQNLVTLVDVVDVALERSKAYLAILGMDGHGTPRLLDPDPRISAGSLHGGGARFSPDGKSLIYAIKEKGIGNVWQQPLDGTPGHALSNYSSDLVAQFRFSPDGRTMAIKRTHTTSDIVVLRTNSK
jgi:Tol biopolymer transport system component